MRIVKPSIEWLPHLTYREALELVEQAGRVAYQSEPKGDPETFIRGLIKRGHCYDGNTEILTSSGFVKFKDYHGEDVMVINKDLTIKGLEPPERIIVQRYTGKVYQYSKLGFTVTAGHKMFGHVIRTARDKKRENYNFRLFSCDNVAQNTGHTKYVTDGEKNFVVPVTCTYDGPINELGKLVGFWVGDGCVGRSGNQLVFHLKKNRKIKYLSDICEKLGYTFKKRKSNYFVVKHKGIGKYFHTHYVRNMFKYLPNMTDQSMISGIMDGLIASDGSIDKHGAKSFSNTSKSVIDWIESHGFMVGWTVFSKTEGNIRHGLRKKTWILNLNYGTRNSKYILLNDSRKPSERVKINEVKNMPVYCVKVSTGIIVVRGSNGRVCLCGNCSVLEHAVVSLKIVHNRAFMAELTRHRLAAFVVESSRFVNYKDKEIEFIQPYWMTDDTLKAFIEEYIVRDDPVYFTGNVLREVCKHRIAKNEYRPYFYWIQSMFEAEYAYAKLIMEKLPPQAARGVLPMDLKTEIFMTCNLRELRHIISLRSSIGSTGASHPDMRNIFDQLLAELKRFYTVFFEDLTLPTPAN